ncbi:hypothetical protein CSB93_2753 [Pseudomonas paraeruginosa]|uniref:Uncharacterized protein n=1 Tax=Pseudomonas paraeruginosa TaxID=2994495 RepID=A0A2R3IVY5_9PSED|nr:hypothetical protein CSB93_2753 [Pseudomonas paraeruginosa]AWE89475.1 hypothetical protein CSC28_1524 [Pseudomonas paraeruginosa]
MLRFSSDHRIQVSKGLYFQWVEFVPRNEFRLFETVSSCASHNYRWALR